MPAHRILLWDIDGTLLHSDRAGSLAMNRAFRELYGIDGAREPLDGINFAGMSDRSIVRLVADACAIPWSDADEARFLDHYETVLAETVAARQGRVLPGVREALDALRDEPVAQGLGTGNFRRTAMVKLRHFALDADFLDGGFGDDSPDRPTLLAAGLERMRPHASPKADCVVIGDTAHDVTAGRAIGARVVAVRTGFAEPGELEAAAPDVLLDDLADLAATLAALLE